MKNLAKKVVRTCAHGLGLEITRYHPPVRSKATGELIFCQTATGNYFLPRDSPNDIIAVAIKANHVFDEEVVDIARQYIKPGSAVLDVGANFGQMTVLFAKLAGASGVVHSFEADDFVFDILKKNVEANGLKDSVQLHFGAVYNEEGKTLFFPKQDFKEYNTYGSYGIDFNAQAGRQVNSLTIDGLDIQRPVSFMKVDIQGADLQGMQGAVETIRRNKMPIIFEYEWRYEDRFKLSFQDYVNFVESINYKFEKVILGQNYLLMPR